MTRDILARARTIAVLGAHVERHRAACYVPDYLAARGYRVLPVNPQLLGRSAWGQPFRATLAELGEPIDIVDVFRAPFHLRAHVPDILAMDPPPEVVWFQSGIRHDAVAQRLEDEGITVVQSRCTMADHRMFGL